MQVYTNRLNQIPWPCVKWTSKCPIQTHSKSLPPVLSPQWMATRDKSSHLLVQALQVLGESVSPTYHNPLSGDGLPLCGQERLPFAVMIEQSLGNDSSCIRVISSTLYSAGFCSNCYLKVRLEKMLLLQEQEPVLLLQSRDPVSCLMQKRTRVYVSQCCIIWISYIQRFALNCVELRYSPLSRKIWSQLSSL